MLDRICAYTNDDAKVNSTMQRIYLGRNGIGDEGALAIAEAMEFNSSLHWIDLDGNEIGNENLELIHQALEGCKNRQKCKKNILLIHFYTI